MKKLIIIGLLFCLQSYAAEPVADPAKPANAADGGAGAIPAVPEVKPEPVAAPRWRFRKDLTISTGRTLSLNDNPAYSGSYSLALAATDVKKSITYSANFAYSQEYTYPRDDGTNGDFERPSVKVSKSLKLAKDYGWKILDTFSYGLSASFPLGAESKRQTFRGSLSPSVAAAKSLGKFSVSQSLSYSRRFYEYDIRLNGVVNSPNSISSSTGLGFDLSEKWSIETSFVYSYGVSYQNVGRSTNSITFSTSYKASDLISLSTGVTTDRGTLEPDGVTNKIRFFDSEKAQGFFDITFSF